MIIHDRDGLSPVQVARINRLELARYRKPVPPPPRFIREDGIDLIEVRKLFFRGLLILGILWAIGLAAFLYIGNETHHGHAVYVPGGIEVYP